MATEELELGGYFPRLITFTGAEQDLPDFCVMIKPNDPCIITSLKVKDNPIWNYAELHGYQGVDIGSEKFSPIRLKDRRNPWFKITGTAGGSCWAYTD